ncbi:hypothetical protein FACS189472_05650 [Alphaproteobacteria bacterium]|nr:hypothetical protein FACS189472_05650 [Alphaproteobacteria bacterium]
MSFIEEKPCKYLRKRKWRGFMYCAKYKERKLTQSEAGRQLRLSERQIRRLLERMSEDISEIRSRKR